MLRGVVFRDPKQDLDGVKHDGAERQARSDSAPSRRKFMRNMAIGTAGATLARLDVVRTGDSVDNCDHDFEFCNWDGSLCCDPKRFCQPQTEAEIVKIVKDTYQRGGVVRTFGAGHSWSPLVLTDDTLVNLDKLKHLVSIDKGQMRATVQAGIRIKELVKVLRRNGLALKNLGSIKEQSIAGAISTATHGTGLNIGSISTQIVAMKLVNGRGEVVDLSVEKNPDLMSAARVSLGSLGIIVEVTIQCVKDYNLIYEARDLPFDKVLDQLDQTLHENERLRLYWFNFFPDTFKVMTMNPTDRVRSPNIKYPDEFTRDIIDRKGTVKPIAASTYDLYHWLGFGLDLAGKKKREIEARARWLSGREVKPYDEALTVLMPPPHQESEYAIRYQRAAEAVRMVRKFIKERNFLNPILVEVRFVDKDDIMLSPAYGQQVCYVGGYIWFDPNVDAFFAGFESIMRSLNGKPHWGKHLTLSAKEAEQMYPRVGEFKRIRREFDPKGIFTNDFIRRLFG